MATPTGQIYAEKFSPYVCVQTKPVAAVSVLIGSIAIMGFSGAPTSGADWHTDINLPLFGTSALRTQLYSAVEEPFTVSGALATIRRATGFTWEELASQFHVSRRAVHDWASGKPLSRKNEIAVRNFVDLVRNLDTGSPTATRSLLAAASTGQSLQPLFQPEPPSARPLSRRAREKIATLGGPILGADQSASALAPPKLIKRVAITVKR